MNTKLNRFLWVFYDFGNSIVFVVFFLYFAQWVVIDKGISDLTLNLTFTIASIALLLTVPITGFLLDKFFRRITGLRYTSGATAILYAICALCTVYNQPTWALVTFTAALYVYLLTFTFYTPLINDIVVAEKRGKLSGMGVAANYLGQFAGLIIVLPFSNGSWSIFGAAARAETLLPAVIMFTILTLPTLIFFKESHREKKELIWKNEIKHLWRKTYDIFVYPGVALFMFAYFLFNDAILTAANNFPILMNEVWGVSDTIKTYIMAGILITSCIGGLVSGIIADKFGHKRTLFFVLTGWVFILPAVGFVTNFTAFAIVTSFMGLWFGANWAVSRSVMSYLAPKEGQNLTFGYFGLVERASSFVGPIVWGLVVIKLVHIGSDRYRWATLAVTMFIVLGLFVLGKVKSDRN